MKLKLTEECCGFGLYLLPSKPMDVNKPVKAIIKAGPREYYEVKGAFIHYVPNQGWALAIPIVKDEVELIYMDYE